MNLLDLARSALPAPTTASDPGEPCRDWLLHFADREPLEVIFSDDLAHGDVLALYPAAVAAMPWTGPSAAPQPEPEPEPAGPFPKLPTCRQCRNLAGNGQCRAAGRRYSPVLYLGRRCTDYRPLPDDPDQRTGAERWPWIGETA